MATSWRRRNLFRWLGIVAGGYLSGLLVLWSLQDRFIFRGADMDAAKASQVAQQLPEVREVWLDAADGTRLHGWWRPARASAAAGRVLMYFGGNAEPVYRRLYQTGYGEGEWDLLLTEYRGYGLSGGTPGQTALQADALRWYDELRAGKLDGMPSPRTVVVMGTSLGSHFATHVAAHRPVNGVVLATPFDSMRALAQSAMPLVPVGPSLRHPMDSRAEASGVRAPTLFIVAADDKTIPPQRARLLFDAWGSTSRTWVSVPSSDHDNVMSRPAYWESLARFLNSLA